MQEEQSDNRNPKLPTHPYFMSEHKNISISFTKGNRKFISFTKGNRFYLQSGSVPDIRNWYA
jgi:hypothetical protein